MRDNEQPFLLRIWHNFTNGVWLACVVTGMLGLRTACGGGIEEEVGANDMV